MCDTRKELLAERRRCLRTTMRGTIGVLMARAVIPATGYAAHRAGGTLTVAAMAVAAFLCIMELKTEVANHQLEQEDQSASGQARDNSQS